MDSSAFVASTAAWLRPVGLLCVNAALFAAGIFNLVVGCIQALAAHETMAITCLVAGLLLLLASSIDRFEVLKGFGIEAKTRALTKVLNEADTTLEHLRQLAETTSESIIELSSSAGRVGGAPSIRDSTIRAQKVRANLVGLGSDPGKIREILRPWARITLYTAIHPLVLAIRETLNQVHGVNAAEAAAIPQPLAPEDLQRHRALSANLNAAVDFMERVRNPWLWPAGSAAPKLAEVLRSMPVQQEADRDRLRSMIEPWLPRFAHFESHQELLDSEAWFALEV